MMRAVPMVVVCAGVLSGQGAGTPQAGSQAGTSQAGTSQAGTSQAGKGNQQPGTQSGTQPGSGHVVPDAIGFRNRGLISPEGHPVPGGGGKMTKLQQERRKQGEEAGPVATAGVMNGDHMFTATALIQPRRLAPGESGTLHVLVLLTQPRMVAVPGGRIELKLNPVTGALKCGEPVLQPAPMARAAKSYAGAAVYEENLIFKVPVDVRKDASFGEHAVPGTVILDLFDADSGDPQGTFAVKVTGTITLGKPLPKPKVAATAGQAPKPSAAQGLANQPANRPGEEPAGQLTANPDVSGRDSAASNARPAGSGVPVEVGDGGLLDTQNSGGRPSMVLYLGMGLCICTLLVLLLISRRE